MTSQTPLTDESGSAVLEFVFGSVVLLIPLVYLALALGTVQAGSYAANAIAVDAARTAARYPDTAPARTDTIAQMHLEDFGLPQARHSVEVECRTRCSEPGSAVTARVRVEVPIPVVHALFGSGSAGTIAVTAQHTDLVAPYFRAGG